MCENKVLESVKKIFFNTFLKFTKTEDPIANYLSSNVDWDTGVHEIHLKCDFHAGSFQKCFRQHMLHIFAIETATASKIKVYSLILQDGN